MDREYLLGQPPSFSELRASHIQDDSEPNRKITDSVLSGLDSCAPLVSLLSRLLLIGLDHSAKKKKTRILRVCGRLRELHAHAARAAGSNEQLLGDDWVSKYQNLIARFTGFARQYEKKRRALLRITRRVKRDEDAQALDVFHREIDALRFELH